MKKNIKCGLSYVGTRYFGWQKTKSGPSIEESLENALMQILGCRIVLQAASRTDKGVHAKGQVVNFFTDLEDLNLEKLQRSLSSLLPKDISLLKVELAEENFHPTLDCLGKKYQYQICNQSVQLPFNRNFSWHFYYTLDLSKMQKGAKILEGTHDFSAFSSEIYENPIRTIHQITLIPAKERRLFLEITGDNFLYKMVRSIVGTLAYVGSGKISLDQVKKILQSKQRRQSGMTAPAHGLCLAEIFY